MSSFGVYRNNADFKEVKMNIYEDEDYHTLEHRVLLHFMVRASNFREHAYYLIVH